MRLTAALLASALLSAGCASVRESPEPARLTLGPCVIGGAEARCGSLVVPENRATRTGRTIGLNTVVLPASGQQRLPDPIFYLAGGPGQGATSLATTGLVDPALRDQRDLVFVDQRGTGESNPLACELPGSPADPQGYVESVFQVAVMEKCRADLAPRADVRLYTTADAADDLDDIRAALGYERINLLGGSYGTRAALIYMRRHPARVRSAVLNGVAPPSLKNPLYHAREAQRALDALFDLCDSDPPCHAAFPRIREEFRAVVERLEREPAAVPLTLPGAAPITVRFSRYAFADAVRMMLYGEAGASNIPLAVHQAYLGNFSVIAQRAVNQRRSNARLMHGMLLATTCAEDVARITDDEVRTLTAGTFLGADRVRQQKEVCAIWPRRDGQSEDGRPVQSDSPVLLLSGTLDPVTPAAWADEALRTLPNGRHLVVPGAHGVAGPCISQIVRQFISAGSAKDLDTACTAGIRLPPFVTGKV